MYADTTLSKYVYIITYSCLRIVKEYCSYQFGNKKFNLLIIIKIVLKNNKKYRCCILFCGLIPQLLSLKCVFIILQDISYQQTILTIVLIVMLFEVSYAVKYHRQHHVQLYKSRNKFSSIEIVYYWL